MPERSAAWGGWVAFAGVFMIIVGALNLCQGLVALIWDERTAVVANRLIVVDVTAYGWVLLVSGALLCVVGAGLLGAQTWARITGIVLVGLHALTQVAWLSAYPIWALLMLAMDTFIIFALTAKWSDAKAALGAHSGAASQERYRDMRAPT